MPLDGENPEYVVAEHDHQADFSSFAERRLASLWNAPIIVTTAISPTQLIQNSVRLRPEKAIQLAKVNGHEDLFKLPDDGYDPEFLGYMKTLLHV